MRDGAAQAPLPLQFQRTGTPVLFHGRRNRFFRKRILIRRSSFLPFVSWRLHVEPPLCAQRKTLFMKREDKHASIELEKMVRHVAGYQRIGGLWGQRR
jgi:hypothetical protein